MLCGFDDALHREHWWEPYSWDRHGIGMSVIYDKDWAQTDGLKDKTISSAKIFGLEAKNTFLPLHASIQLEDMRIELDRAYHSIGSVQTLYDPKTRKKIGEESGFGYISIYRTELPGSIFKIDDSFPIKGARPLEKIIERLAGQKLAKLNVRGNNTMAVGLLPTTVLLEASNHYALIFHLAQLGNEEIRQVFGKGSGLDRELYSLVVRGVTIKKE